MTKKDTRKYVLNILIGALAAVIIFCLVCQLAPAKWTGDNKLLVSFLTAWILAWPGAFASRNIDKWLTEKHGKEWDGGLSIPGTWGPLAIGSGVVNVLFLIASWLL